MPDDYKESAPEAEPRAAGWALATAIAVALTVALLPLVPVAMVAGRWGHGADR